MKTVLPLDIAKIDAFAISFLGISEAALIRRAGEAIADALEECGLNAGASILFLCGGGNNGADGYAAATVLHRRAYRALAVDVFNKGQRSEGGRAVLNEYISLVGEPLSLEAAGKHPDVIVDAMFGTGFSGDAPERALLAADLARSSGARVFAVDVPFGVDAAWGSVTEKALRAEATVVLSFMKRGLLSYPAKEFTGKLILKDIGLDIPAVHKAFPHLTDTACDAYAQKALPPRKDNSHKGSYGNACLFVGSAAYRGAALLALEAAFRGGAGLVTLLSEKAVTDSALLFLPEALYKEVPPFSAWGDKEISAALSATKGASVVLVGCGCGQSEALCRFIHALLLSEGAPLLLDADAINSLALRREESLSLLKKAKREVLLTPHPLELSRLSGLPLQEIQAERLRVAADFSGEYGIFLLLKGAGSVIGAKGEVFVNTSGSSALSKGGTGDVLAGFTAALLSQGAASEAALRVGAYLHGKAGDTLAKSFSEHGVLPSELPKQIAIEMAKIIKM